MINNISIINELSKCRLIYGSALTIGTEITDTEESDFLLERAWANGIRYFDTSNNYGNGHAEVLLGHFLKKKCRDDYFIISKVGWPGEESPFCKGLSWDCLNESIRESLNRLNLAYLDLYIAHRLDTSLKLLNIIKSFNELISNGLIRSWGTSEWPIKKIEETLKLCEKYGLIKPVCDQFVYSYLIDKNESNGRRSKLQNLGLICLGYSPLAQGLLTGKYHSGIPISSRISKSSKIQYHKTIQMLENEKLKLETFENFCLANNLDFVFAAICWVLSKNVIPIFGASNSRQLEIIGSLLFEECEKISWL